MKKPTAFIYDVDGTIVDVSSIRHHVLSGLLPDGTYKRSKNFDAFHTEAINCPVIEESVTLIRKYEAEGHLPLAVTARSQKYGRHTGFFLAMHNIPSYAMFMRRNGDHRLDSLVKRDFWEVISSRFEIVGAIDDNPSIVELWEDVGIPNVHVVPGYIC